MPVCVLGAGYVGLVVATCLARAGVPVRCIERDPERVSRLRAGLVPFYEPGLQEELRLALAAGTLTLHGDTASGASGCSMAFIAVGTPPDHRGEPDAAAAIAAAREVAPMLAWGAVLVMKSTVPVGTTLAVQGVVRRDGRGDLAVVSNPEFLAEGQALSGFLRPDRVVIGAEDPQAAERVAAIYRRFVPEGTPVLRMGLASAEMAKLASNAALAARVSLMNELAALCEASGADIEQVGQALGADSRIGARYLRAGVGYGGSCLPKDVSGLVAMGGRLGLPVELLSAVASVNARQRERVFARLLELSGWPTVRGRRVAVWGLTFKPDTDDVREAPAMAVVRALLAAGADVVAWDPVAVVALADAGLVRADDPLEALHGADALLLMTEWSQLRAVSPQAMARVMRERIVVDGRNVLDPSVMVAAGFRYAGIGRPSVVPSAPVSPSSDPPGHGAPALPTIDSTAPEHGP